MTAFQAASRVDVPIRSPISDGSVCIRYWKTASCVGRRRQVEVAGLGAERVAQRAQQRVPVDLERVLVRPEALHDLQAGSRPYDWIVRSRPPGRRLRASGARIFSALNDGRHARAPRLRGEDEVVLPPGAPGPGMTVSSRNSWSSR